MNDSEAAENLLSDEQRLVLHQLQLLQWMDARNTTTRATGEQEPGTARDEPRPVPREWELTRNVSLYPWQDDCIGEWFAAGFRGTVKVVTGGGKTLLALAIAERLQREKDHDLRIAIIAPTIVLMNQWFEELEQHSNLPRAAIGRLGGGHSDDFGGERRILICVLASAYKLLPPLVTEELGRHLLFVADECHRAGAAEMSKVLAVPRAYSLGLSATPERDEDEDENTDPVRYEDSLLGKALGGVVYELTLARAVDLGIIPKFTIRHYGLTLDAEEAQRYDRLTRSIEDGRKQLQQMAASGRRSGIAFYRWVRSVSEKGGTRTNSLASRFMMDTRERKELLYRIKARQAAVVELLKREFENQHQARAILFHESIDEVMALFERLRVAGFAVVAEHSDLPDGFREQSLELFRRGVANVIVSAKSLIEGFNVPSADIGIIVASSTSVRQRIQSLGRVLRKHRGPSGEEKTSVIHVLYARDTVDDAIYAKTNWEDFTGAERNVYYSWDPPAEPIEQFNPPRTPLPHDVDIDGAKLKPGDPYEGQYEGIEYSSDTQGNIRDGQGRYAKNPGLAPSAVRTVKGGAGRFRVTPNRRYLLVRVPEGDDWVTRFVMQQEEPFDFSTELSTSTVLDWAVHQKWIEAANPGDQYPFPETGIQLKLNFRQRRGGVLTRPVPNGEVYARVGADAADHSKGEDARKLLAACRRLQTLGLLASQIEINETNDAICRTKGQRLFLSHLESGLEFPSLGAE